MPTGLALAIAAGSLTASALLQQTSPPAPRPPATVTIAGCVQQSAHATPDGDVRTAADAASPPANAADALPDTRPLFVLSDARTIAPAAPVGTAGLATTRHADGSVVQEDPRRAPRTYALVGAGDVLTRFVGRRVEIDGTPAPPARQGEEHERLTVVRVRQVALSCDSPARAVR